MRFLQKKEGIAVLLFLVFIFIAGYFVLQKNRPQREVYPEVAEVSFLKGDYTSYAEYFKKLAEKKGAVYAFEVLKRSQLAANTDLHLLGHVVGDELYKQKKVEGIAYCTNDFRNACSHAVVVGTLLEKGDSVLESIGAICKKAPGGKGAYTMCFHGLGHGILAYVKYELPSAITLCARVGTEEYHQREYIECVGGVIMELMGGGDHDKKLWSSVRRKYLKDDDPLYPCDASFVPDQVRSQCYEYLTPHLFETAGGNLGRPQPSDFAKAFKFCDAILPRSPVGIENRTHCYGAFGKEFIPLAQNRDIRKIEAMTSEQLTTVVGWCGLAGDAKGTLDCDDSALQSLYWGGENKPDAALRFCNVMPVGIRQSACFRSLVSSVSFYIDNLAYRKTLCNQYPLEYQSECRSILIKTP